MTKIRNIFISLSLILIGVLGYSSLAEGDFSTLKNQNIKNQVNNNLNSNKETQSKASNAVDNCSNRVGRGLVFFDALSWEIPNIGELSGPKKTTFCKFDDKGGNYILIVAAYTDAAEAELALKDATKRDGYLFLGVPSGIYEIKALQSKGFFLGKISSDDCGMNGIEYMDVSCPLGKAIFKIEDKEIVIIAERFEKNQPEEKSSLISYQKIL